MYSTKSARHLAIVILCSAFVIFGRAPATSQEKPEIVYASPSGALRIENNGEEASVVSTNGRQNRHDARKLGALALQPVTLTQNYWPRVGS